MAAIHKTAYPRFKPYFTAKELDNIFSLSPDEIAFLNRKPKITNTVSRLSFPILLKCYQHLGRPIKVDKMNTAIKKYIAKQLSIEPDVDLTVTLRRTYATL